MIFDVYPLIENDNLILKKLSIEDLSNLESMVNEKDVYQYEPTFLPELKCISLEKFILEDCDILFKNKKNIILGIYLKSNNEFIGLCELYGYSLIRNKISIGYRLKAEYWHKKIGSQVVALFKH